MGLIYSYVQFLQSSSKRFRLLTLLPFWISLTAIVAAPICDNCDGGRDATTFKSAPIPFETVRGSKAENVIQGAVGGTHKYLLQSGEYVHFTIEQKRVDLSVTLLDPHGRVLLRFNHNRYMYGSERLSWTAKQSGVYSLRLEAQGSLGTYEVRLDERRPAKPEDSLRFQAEQQVTLALRYKDAGQERRALDALKIAGRLWKDLQDRLEQTSVLNEMGNLYCEIGDIRQAVDSHEQALDLNKSVDSKFEWTVSLIGLGDARVALGEPRQALDYYEQALALTRSAGNPQSESVALARMGMVNHNLGNLQLAFDSFQQALAISRDLSDRQEEVQILLGLGSVYDTLNEKERALELWNLALIHCRELADRKRELFSLLNIGKAYRSLGDTTRAVEIFRQSLRQSQRLSNYRVEAYSLDMLAEVYSGTGNVRVSLKHYEQALKLSRQFQDLKKEAQILYAISSLQESLGEYAPAARRLNAALLLSRSIADRRSEANALYLLARIKSRQGKFSESIKDIEAALQIIESVSYKIETQVLRASYLASVRQYYDFYIDLLMKLDQLHPQEGYAAAAIQISERGRARILYNLLMESRLTEQGSDRSLMERERSLRQLLSAKTAYQMSLLGRNLAPDEAEGLARDIEVLTLEYQEVQNNITRENPADQLFSQPPLPSLKEIQGELPGDTLLLEYTLGPERSYLWVVSSDSIIAHELPSRAVIEEAANQVYRLLTGPQALSSETQAKISQTNKQYWERASALSQTLLGKVAGELGEKRLLIVSDGALNYIPFSALPKPSKENTSAEVRPLVVDHEIVNLPSASVLVSLRRRNAHRPRPTRAIAVIADPVFERDDPRLRTQSSDTGLQVGLKGVATRDVATWKLDSQLSSVDEPLRLSRLYFANKEAHEILNLLPARQGFAALGVSATRDLVMSNQLSSFSVIHFATHGVSNGEYPELSGIFLSTVNQYGGQENGFLQLHDVYNLNLSADLIVLSSCNTALGKNFAGEGLIGLTQGFMYAGAQGVVASLWKVDDQATADLMGLFYNGMIEDGLKPATALRKAQIEMWQQSRWHAPYYWAAFTLQGEWNQAITIPPRDADRFWMKLAIILLVGGIGLVLFYRMTFSLRSIMTNMRSALTDQVGKTIM